MQIDGSSGSELRRDRNASIPGEDQQAVERHEAPRAVGLEGRARTRQRARGCLRGSRPWRCALRVGYVRSEGARPLRPHRRAMRSHASLLVDLRRRAADREARSLRHDAARRRLVHVRSSETPGDRARRSRCASSVPGAEVPGVLATNREGVRLKDRTSTYFGVQRVLLQVAGRRHGQAEAQKRRDRRWCRRNRRCQ